MNTETTEEPQEREQAGPYKRKTREELKSIAQQLIRGQIFSSAHLLGEGEERMLGSVFMPLAFSGPDSTEWMKDNNITFVYEEISKAGPMAINGLPSFFSCCMLNDVDHAEMADIAKALQEAIDNV